MITNKASISDLITPENFITAGADEELIERPAFRAWISIKGDGSVYANGRKLHPIEIYANGIRLFEFSCTIMTPIGRRPGISSLRITPGARYKSRIVSEGSVKNCMRYPGYKASSPF